MLAQEPDSVWVRAFLVAVAVGGSAVWIVAMVRFLLTQDEFARRVHVTAAAVPLLGTMIGLVAADVLQSAGFLGYVPLEEIWMSMIVLWLLSMFGVARYYR